MWWWLIFHGLFQIFVGICCSIFVGIAMWWFQFFHKLTYMYPYVYFFGTIFSRVVAVREYLPPREADINKWDEKQIAPIGYAVACGDLSFQLETADLVLGFRECIYIIIHLYLYLYVYIYISLCLCGWRGWYSFGCPILKQISPWAKFNDVWPHPRLHRSSSSSIYPKC